MLPVPSPTESERALAKKMVLKRQQLISSQHPEFDKKMIHSIRSGNNYISCVELYLAWRSNNHLSNGQIDNKSQVIAYLDERSEIYQQATLDQHRLALMKTFGLKLPYFIAKPLTLILPRDYDKDEVNLITDHQEDHNAISTLLAFYCGLRAHEMISLRPLDERSPSKDREWRNDLFHGLPSYVLYTTKGKGGLVRLVAIPVEIAELLEKLRLTHPRKVADRGIFGEIIYDIGYGQSLSQSFSTASTKYLGYSTGFHGLRHSYAKSRYRTLIQTFSFNETLLIISQELGHFRSDITHTYFN